MVPVRKAVRVLLVNERQELLLMKVEFNNLKKVDGTPSPSRYWITLGGKIENGENIQDAAIREIYEEAGITSVTIGPVVWFETFHLSYNDVLSKYDNTYIVMKTKEHDISDTHWTDGEKNYVKDIRWFSLNDLEKEKRDIHPVNPTLAQQYFPEIFKGNYPEVPLYFDV